MVAHILREQPILAQKNVPDTVHLSFANSWYAYIVALDLIGVDVDTVDDGVASELQFHLRNNFDSMSGAVFERTTILMMDLVMRAYGRRARWSGGAAGSSLARRLWPQRRKARTGGW
ncbi:hypothetical protein DEW08_07680 [Azospirillum thermophilum]|uniref:Uncharacterized protein n=2 Tax=Azospirillum thermophilum TaxID=2202148 RepID=A0A2S2CP98_9PROT|nr:hypothetical protein DEW08_07680 [Azospirillum thermophilum]